jgi:2,3,4,5-tetrahydropyridine-2-carboxylate N-succinyltransferase
MEIKRITEEAWENRAELATADIADLNNVITSVFEDLDSGRQRIAEKINGQWQVNTWLKKAVLLSFRLWDNKIGDLSYDKVPLKFANWDSERFKNSGIRAVHGNVVRYGAYIAPKVVLMPSFVNLGKNCHISGGAGIGGVLEPLQANPVIIEDNCFIGARSEVVEGMIIEEGAVIGMGVFLGASTPIMDRSTGDITYGRIPPYSVVISGTLPGKPLQDGRPGPNLPCAVIVKQVDERTRSKTSINELLRPL